MSLFLYIIAIEINAFLKFEVGLCIPSSYAFRFRKTTFRQLPGPPLNLKIVVCLEILSIY